MRNPHGQAEWMGREGTRHNRAADTITCHHCNGAVIVQEKPEPNYGGCLKCMERICLRCVAKGSCTPFELQLERMEKRAAARRSFLQAVGV